MSAFSLPFMQTALAASLLAGNALALVGAFILMGRISFSGLAAAQLAALGTVLSAVWGLHAGGFGVTAAAVGAGFLLLAALGRERAVPGEAWVAMLYILGAGLSILVLSKAPMGEARSMGVFFGNILALGPREVWESAGVLAAAGLVLGPWLGRWVWISFDPLAARVAGLRVGAWQALFLALFALAMTVSIHVFGVLLAFAYLILPAAAALLACQGMRSLLIFIPVLTTATTVAGLELSLRWDLPSGPLLAALLSSAVLVLAAWRRLFPR